MKKYQPAEVVGLFDRIAPVYDLLNRTISLGQDQRWRRELARRMSTEAGQWAVDLSTGTGDQALALQRLCPGLKVLGLDPAANMMALYRRKDPSALLALSRAEALPLPHASVDRITCSFGLRNFADRAAGLGEIRRVLKSDGRWGFLEMTAPGGALFPALYGLYFKHLVPILGTVISAHPWAYRYLKDTVYAFPRFAELKAEHERAGFSLEYYRPIMRGAVGLYVFRKI